MPAANLPETFLMEVVRVLKAHDGAQPGRYVETDTIAQSLRWKQGWGEQPASRRGMPSLAFMAAEILFRRGFIEAYEDSDDSGLYRISGKGLFYLQEYDTRAAASLRVSNSTVVRAAISTAPASDRIVPLDHNAPEYRAIADGIAEADAIVAGDNELASQDRDRIRLILASASNLWKATELKRIQVEVGVIMALEDAAALIKATARQVAIKIVIDLIRQFLGRYLGV